MNKEAEMILKYKDRKIEIQCMWNVKRIVVPATRATGTISKIIQKILEQIQECGGGNLREGDHVEDSDYVGG